MVFLALGQLCFFHDFSGPEEVRAEVEAASLRAEEVAPGWWVCRLGSKPAG